MPKYRRRPVDETASSPNNLSIGQPIPCSTPAGIIAQSSIPSVSGFQGTIPSTGGAMAAGFPGLAAMQGMGIPPNVASVSMGIPLPGVAGVHGVGAMGANAAHGLMMPPGSIPGIVRAPPMMAGITPSPALPPGVPFGHPMMRPPMGGHQGKK